MRTKFICKKGENFIARKKIRCIFRSGNLSGMNIQNVILRLLFFNDGDRITSLITNAKQMGKEWRMRGTTDGRKTG